LFAFNLQAYTHGALCKEWVKGDHLSGVVKLIKNLDERLVDQISDSVEAPIRAKILSTVLEAVLQMPTPYPKYLFQAQPLPLLADLKISADPRDVKLPDDWRKIPVGPEDLGLLAHKSEDGCDDDGDQAEIIDVSDGLACSLLVSGTLPRRYLQTIKQSTMLSVSATYEIKYDGGLAEGDDGTGTIINEDGMPSMQDDVPPATPDYFGVPSRHTQKHRFTTSRISPQGAFQIELECVPPEREGYYQVEVALTVMDSTGGEWSLVLPAGSTSDIVYLCVGQVQTGNENDESVWSNEAP
jgi:hypothetical protein